jgi:hypothetical protein
MSFVVLLHAQTHIYANNDAKQSCVDAGNHCGPTLLALPPISCNRLSAVAAVKAEDMSMMLFMYWLGHHVLPTERRAT